MRVNHSDLNGISLEIRVNQIRRAVECLRSSHLISHGN